MAEVLLVDIGNSYIKVSKLDTADQVIFTCPSVEELCHWLTSGSARIIWCSNVRNDAQLAPLTTFCANTGVRLEIVCTSAEFQGLLNSYKDVSTMGVDRWLAMIAAVNITEKPCAVMMFGTAITCDVIVDKRHQGGWIVPGRSLMQNAVSKNTDRVFTDAKTEEAQLTFGNSTPMCVSAGCFAAASGLIFSIERRLSGRYKDFEIIVSGGDKEVYEQAYMPLVKQLNNIVLRGLAAVALAKMAEN